MQNGISSYLYSHLLLRQSLHCCVSDQVVSGVKVIVPHMSTLSMLNPKLLYYMPEINQFIANLFGFFQIYLSLYNEMVDSFAVYSTTLKKLKYFPLGRAFICL